ncbi:siderophore ABC transporter permease [Mesorhizobium sp. L-8-10]|uniref:FecCD family ABC transporter permease n=1 Tax=Mesorhizobium sp. L-8-10 TaxID=2744523 RepID=UPI001936BE31|nr:iron ABC transporter permease [Mesorhizobium sp. L-8-10]BCH30734.1 siderophore ABC transporter permease [Mesorhizobium sp. L-8-10]
MTAGSVTVGADARRFSAFAALGLLVAVVAVWSVTLGASRIAMSDVLAAIFAFDGSREHLVVRTLRLPRAMAGLLSGSALAVAGAIMQAVTNNPLASPGLLGVNAGAAFAIVMAMSFIGVGSSSAQVWFAFGGAGIAAVVVYALASVGSAGVTPLKLVLAGVVVTTFLSSLTTAILIFDQTTLDAVRLWTAGSLTGRSLAQVAAVAPYILAGLAAALIFRRHIMTLSLGTEVAASVGQDPVLWRGLAVAIVILLAGGAVALAGPVAFVGLVVPHIARMIVGVDYRWIIPFSAAGGALLIVLADLIGRTIFANQSFPVGVTMALVGAPFFIWLARSRAGDAR